ncbi:beta-ketoacyl synthase [Tsukamurella sp. 8F]|uniref:beta-ketoacyl synthase n=1 Tax=unclassified Tsukamurella TaxID=2633480 RepID=UPI0023B8AC70|nr:MULTISPECIES: beta-ketoacyl synthase [unclassified Tsukamurella]MDF0529507.1 beta-ketoacyl synthase [Tsukamurella sp. 8J]MDF0585805.1 beta-ketoacyl synthase [Tsukamurella sp. 8F]
MSTSVTVDGPPPDAMQDEPAIDFEGQPFDPAPSSTSTVDSAAAPASPAERSAAASVRDQVTATSHAQSSAAAGAVAMAPLSELRRAVLRAHRAAVIAQARLQRRHWDVARGQVFRHDAAALSVQHALPVEPAPEGSFKPLNRPRAAEIGREAIVELLTAAGFEGECTLDVVRGLSLRGGAYGAGALIARPLSNGVPAVASAAAVFAAAVGLSTCIPNPVVEAAVPVDEPIPAGEFSLHVHQIDLVPRPHLTAVAEFAGGMRVPVVVQVCERTGAQVGPGPGGAPPTPSARLSIDGETLLLNEFHMAHLSRGDQGIAMGPEYAGYTGRRATRLPTGGLLLVDRVLRFDGRRGSFEGVAEYDTEYDAAADSWYYADTANESMPHFVYMETSLQAALLMGYFAGPTLVDPGAAARLRNLGGTATVLRRIDLRDKTISQHSRLLSTTILPGSSLQTFDYTLSVDGEPFYRGETMFGYFSDEALANQTGLDAGAPRPPWQATRADPPHSRRIDIEARRRAGGPLPRSRDKLALLDSVDVVDGGGEYGLGYLHAVRPIVGDEWYFERHFHLDPVIPGSLGVETVIQAVQEWMLDAGYGDSYAVPAFALPQNIPFTWKYRGQFLPTDGSCEFEAHIKSVEVRDDAVVVTVDASLWKPGLRIYELTDLGVELRDRGGNR